MIPLDLQARDRIVSKGGGVASHALVIRKVQGMFIDDQAEIGSYDVKSISLAGAEGRLLLVSNMPLTIGFEIEGLEVELQALPTRGE